MTGLGRLLGTRQGCLSRVLEGAEGQAAPCQHEAHAPPLASSAGLRLKCGCFKWTHPRGLIPRALSVVIQWRLLRKAWYPALREKLWLAWFTGSTRLMPDTREVSVCAQGAQS